MKLLNFAVAGALLVTIAPASADAQTDFKDRALAIAHKAGVHLNMSVREPGDPDVSKGRTFGISAGLSPGRKNGWRYPVSLTMFSENLHSPNGEPFAVMSSKAITAGIGYGWNFGRLNTGASLQTGYAFNRGKMEGDTQLAFGQPGSAVSVDADNAWLLRPQIKAEYFLTRKLTLRATADYIMMRPGITVTTPTERIVDRWNPSHVHANVGIGFYPGRK